MRSSSRWMRVKNWPTECPARRLGIPDAFLSSVRKWYDSGLVFERLAPSPASHATELRIACRRGEIYPVTNGTWAWAGPCRRWVSGIIEAAGPAATGPFGTGVSKGTGGDELVLWFPEQQLPAVADAAMARRRRSTWQDSSIRPPKTSDLRTNAAHGPTGTTC